MLNHEKPNLIAGLLPCPPEHQLGKVSVCGFQVNAAVGSGISRQLHHPAQHRWVGSQVDASLSSHMPLAAALSTSQATEGAVSLAATSSASTRSKAAATSSGLAIAAKSAVSWWRIGT